MFELVWNTSLWITFELFKSEGWEALQPGQGVDVPNIPDLTLRVGRHRQAVRAVTDFDYVSRSLWLCSVSSERLAVYQYSSPSRSDRVFRSAIELETRPERVQRRGIRNVIRRGHLRGLREHILAARDAKGM